MYYTGIDYHKHYSVACTLDAQSRKIREARIGRNAPEAFAGKEHDLRKEILHRVVAGSEADKRLQFFGARKIRQGIAACEAH